MNTYQTNLIKEHSELIVRTKNLHDDVYGQNEDNKIEYANKCIQLAAMKKYEEVLRARLENSGIVFENGNYFERVASINVVPVVAVSIPAKGNDYDEDAANQDEKPNAPESNE